MGFGGISIWQLLIILVIVVLIFGTRKLRGMGGDLGSAIKSFKKAVKEDKEDKEETAQAAGDEAGADARKAALDEGARAESVAGADSKAGDDPGKKPT